MADVHLHIEGLRKTFGHVVASDGIDLEVRRGEVHALIGPNGAGKTTLINQIMGEMTPNSGRILLDGIDITRRSVRERVRLGLGRSFQISQVFPDISVLENAVLAARASLGTARLLLGDALEHGPARERAEKALSEVNLSAASERSAASLAHGEQKQLDIAVALAGAPHCLLLDEPLAGLGPEDARSMVELLGRLKGRMTILLVEHDMGAVFSLADRISVLVYGRCIATGGGDEIRTNPEVRAAYLGEEQTDVGADDATKL